LPPISMRNNPRSWTARSLPALLALAVCACSAAPAERADQEAKAAAAAAATADLVASEWMRGAVPEDYAARTISAAQARIDDVQRQLRDRAASDATLSLESITLKQLAAILSDLRSSLQTSDRGGVERALGDLKARRSDLLHSQGGA
jgi:membrane-bound lytic murein transglycosylase B